MVGWDMGQTQYQVFAVGMAVSLWFVYLFAGYCRSKNAVGAFRTSVAYTDFLKQWNLQIYFTLRYV